MTASGDPDEKNAPTNGESPLRSLMAEASDQRYVSFRTLEEARAHADAAVVMEGDDGGTIYLTIPVRKISCPEDALGQLLVDIDALYWGDPPMCRLCYEILPVGSRVAGGMGGGETLDGLWLNPAIAKLVMREEIEAVLSGKCNRLPGPLKHG